ncbi:MAG TPA: peptide-binding protein [Alphaproteobacteria bacterium]|nr:peptide-binding protein [Alphaproteobacteria bacterium]
MKRWALFALLALAACKPQQQAQLPDYSQQPEAPAKGDTTISTIGSDPANLVPLLAGEVVGAEIAGNIYQSLVTYDANLNLIPQLAEKWEFSDGGKTLTFTLKPNLTFSDGSPLTSADCLASLQAITNPKTRTPHAGDYLLVTKAETPDAHTFRVHYAEPLVTTLSTWAGFAIMPKKVIDQTPDFNQTTLREKPMGSGSYKLSQWKHGQYLYLTANPSSTEAPYISNLFYRILPDDSAEWLELKAGNLDLAGLSPLAFSRLTDAPWFTRQYQKIHYLGNGYTFLGFNLKNPKFQNKLVRQALSYAVDREGLINAVFFGQAQPMAGVFKPGTWAYNPHLKPYPFDPAKARELLKQAGYTPDAKGTLRNARGEALDFTVTTNQNNEQRMKAVQVLQKCFADIGVRMTIRAQEWSTFVTNTIRNRDFEAVMLGWSLSAEPDPYDIWHSSKTAPAEFNMISYNNPEADRLMVAARKEFDQTKRQQLLWQFQAILADEQPYLFLYAPEVLMAVQKRIVGVAPAPAGIGYNSWQWYVPKPWQLRNNMQP